ncbi:MAG: hypothetical protein IKR39_11065 [Lachnospiraceae bacterium]|nr:hypothetical protein [Lachnospiraceae bacterium]
MIKRILGVLCVAAMVLSLGACTMPWVKENPEQAESVSSNDVSANSMADVRGYYEGNVYKNKYFNFKLIPARDYYFPDAELVGKAEARGQEIINGAKESVSEETAEILNSGESGRFNICSVTDGNTLNLIHIGVFPAYGLTEEGLGLYMAYLSVMIDEIFTADGRLDCVSECSATIFRGEVAPCICTHNLRVAPDGGMIDVYQKNVFIIKEEYVAQITVTAYFSDITDKLLDMISYLY